MAVITIPVRIKRVPSARNPETKTYKAFAVITTGTWKGLMYHMCEHPHPSKAEAAVCAETLPLPDHMDIPLENGDTHRVVVEEN